MLGFSHPPMYKQVSAHAVCQLQNKQADSIHTILCNWLAKQNAPQKQTASRLFSKLQALNTLQTCLFCLVGWAPKSYALNPVVATKTS